MPPAKNSARTQNTPRRGTTPTRKLAKATAAGAPPVPQASETPTAPPSRSSAITVETPMRLPVTRYVNDWLIERLLDPVYSSDERVRELERACGVNIQPYQHAAHHRFPTVASKFELERWIPRRIEPPRSDSSGNAKEPLSIMGSRALLCYHAKADSGKESSKCHINCLPGLLFTHRDLFCLTAHDRGFPTLAWNWKINTAKPRPGHYLSEMLFRACWICTSHGYSHCGISGIKIHEIEDKAVSEYIPQSPSNVIDFVDEDDIAAKLKAGDTAFVDELESEEGALIPETENVSPRAKRAREPALDISTPSPPPAKRRSISPGPSVHSLVERRHERSPSIVSVSTSVNTHSDHRSFVASLRARAAGARSTSATLPLSGFVPVSSATLDQHTSLPTAMRSNAFGRTSSAQHAPPVSAVPQRLSAIAESSIPSMSPSQQSALARNQIDDILASHLLAARSLLDQTVLGEQAVKAALDSIFAEHENIDKIKAEKVKLKEEQRQLERRVVRFRNESAEQRKEIEALKHQEQFLSSQIEDIKRDYELDNNLYTEAVEKREEMEKERDAAIAARDQALAASATADHLRVEAEGFATQAVEEADNAAQRVRDLEIETETLWQEIDKLKALIPPAPAQLDGGSSGLRTPSQQIIATPGPPPVQLVTPSLNQHMVRGLPVMRGTRLPLLPSGVAVAPVASAEKGDPLPASTADQPPAEAGLVPPVDQGQPSDSLVRLQETLAEIDSSFPSTDATGAVPTVPRP